LLPPCGQILHRIVANPANRLMLFARTDGPRAILSRMVFAARLCDFFANLPLRALWGSPAKNTTAETAQEHFDQNGTLWPSG
jgi:hypothetical protein